MRDSPEAGELWAFEELSENMGSVNLLEGILEVAGEAGLVWDIRVLSTKGGLEHMCDDLRATFDSTDLEGQVQRRLRV